MIKSQADCGISRREFIKRSATSLAVSALFTNSAFSAPHGIQLRLGGPLLKEPSDPGQWAVEMRKLGYSAASLPLTKFYDTKINVSLIQAYADAAAKADITISEIAEFFNTFPNEEERKKTIERWTLCLEVADRIDARCSVTVAGERIPRTVPGGPSAINLTPETFDMIVENTRKVIDAVKPKRTYFAYQTMGWFYPNSPDDFVKLLKAVDRERFAAHLDITNLMNGADRYFNNAEFVRECFRKLGPRIRSCHAKDVILHTDQPIRIIEVPPGLGKLDYRTFLKELSKFPEIPIMLEHWKTAEEYASAAQYIRSVANEIGVSIRS
jgi:sugar phosphate isomerase/epimerase